MKRDDAIADLVGTFGRKNIVIEDLQVEPGMKLAIITAPQQVSNRDVKSQVAFKLAEVISGRPQQFVEPHMTLSNGAQPNNANTQELNGRLWKTWSLNTSWDAGRHTLSQLVDTVIKQWDR
jgi:hypothetical protein